MNKWKWRRRHRPDRDAARGKPRQTVKARIREMIPREEDNDYDRGKGVSAEGTGQHSGAFAA